jgi:hypothetical protein
LDGQPQDMRVYRMRTSVSAAPLSEADAVPAIVLPFLARLKPAVSWEETR